jgi:hypothetical protein
MKKTSFMLMMVTVLSAASINCQAQFLFLAKMGGEMAVKHVIKHNILHSSSDKSSSNKEAARSDKAAARLQKANLRATSAFNKEFKNHPNAEWYVEDQVIAAYFKDGDITTRAIYDKKGNWIHTIKIYTEDRMPNDVKRTVKQQYSGYDITQVQEVKERENTFYVVHLHSGKTYKQVCVCNNETQVLEEFTESA